MFEIIGLVAAHYSAACCSPFLTDEHLQSETMLGVLIILPREHEGEQGLQERLIHVMHSNSDSSTSAKSAALLTAPLHAIVIDTHRTQHLAPGCDKGS